MTGTADPEVVTLETVNLGDRSYVVALDGHAVVVDPQRDTDRVLDALGDRRLVVTHVLETHVHNDYVTGGPALARETGAVYALPAGEDVAFPARALADGEGFDSGPMRWRVIHTPGHTPTHLSYALAVEGRDVAVFTGGSLLYGNVGRPDLCGPELAPGLARSQWSSARRLVAEVSGDATLYPTHGFGSFCSAGPTSTGGGSRLGDQLALNPALTLPQDRFVDDLLAGLGAYPAYYTRMAAINRRGPRPVDLSLPRPADPEEVRRRLDAGEWVVDLRDRRVFAAGHVRGSLSFPLDGNAVTHLGWLLPWGTPVTLIGSTPGDVSRMQREVVRIGIDRPAAFAIADPGVWASTPWLDVSSYPVSDVAGLRDALTDDPGSPVLDVRLRDEWEAGHVAGARHVSVHDLPGLLDDVRGWAGGRTVRVYCGSGFRAGIAASLLDAAGVPVVHIADDVPDGGRGLPWSSGP